MRVLVSSPDPDYKILEIHMGYGKLQVSTNLGHDDSYHLPIYLSVYQRSLSNGSS